MPPECHALENNFELSYHYPIRKEGAPCCFCFEPSARPVLQHRMPLRNPRQYMFWPALAVTLGLILATFASISFELGNGDFLAGASQAGDFFLLLSVLILMLGTFAIGLALLLGRVIGTSAMMAGMFPLLLAWVIYSALDSGPTARFRRLIWQDAPKSLRIESSRIWPTFKDGTTYTFVIISEGPETIPKLCQAAGLTKLPPGTGALPRSILFPGVTFSADVEFYQSGPIELTYAPSLRKAFIVHALQLPRNGPATVE